MLGREILPITDRRTAIMRERARILLIGVGELGGIILGFFALSLVLIIASLIAFLRDLFVSLVALQVEVRRARGQA